MTVTAAWFGVGLFLAVFLVVLGFITWWNDRD